MHATVETARMLRFLLVPIMMSVAATSPAHAVATAALSTFIFSGQCSDCNGTATGTLTLQNYNLGDTLSAANFISFAYDGTNLFPSYTVTLGTKTSLAGSIDGPLPTSENVSIQDGLFSLYTGTPGYWCVGGSCNADFGVSHQWSVPASVPEPISLSLLGGTLIGLAALRRKA